MKKIEKLLENLFQQVARHPVGKMQLSRAALNAFAVAQYRDSRVWAGLFVTMRDIVTNPVLKSGLEHNFRDEVGNLSVDSHLTLCLQFLRSLGLDPADATSGVYAIGSHAEKLASLIPNMTEAEVAGWVLGAEELVPALFALFLPQFELIEQADTKYLTEHIHVDAGDHAIQMKLGCASILEQNPESIDQMLFGLELAGRFTLSLVDEIMATYGRNRASVFFVPTLDWHAPDYLG